MDAWPEPGFAAIDRYVRSLHLRDPHSREQYQRDLCAFQRFVQSAQAGAGVTEATLTDWIRREGQTLSDRVLCNRMTLLNRFLNDLVTRRQLAISPFTTLRVRHSIPSIGPLVRALAAPDSECALRQAQVPASFGSPLGPMLREHVSTMQALGYRYLGDAARLRQFDRFLQAHPELRGRDLAGLITAFRNARPGLEHQWASERLARNLSDAWSRAEPSVARHRMDRRVREQVERLQRRPYIYSPEQIERLLTVALARHVPRSPLIAFTTFTMIALAYGAGLRVSELVALTLDDVDLEAGVVTIRDSKFFKTRRVPLHATLLDALRGYRERRAATGADPRPTARFFWHEARFAGYSRAAARELLVIALRQAGLKPARGKCGPRIHDLRHTFVVHRLLDWYRRGIDPGPLLPGLSAYLGHASLHSTLLYVTVTRGLLGLAAERFREVGAAHLHAEEVSP